MNLVDSSGWIEYFAGTENGSLFAPAIKNTDKLLVPTICVLEVFKHILRHKGEDKALEIVACMAQCKKIVDLDFILALNAASLGIEYKIPLADSIILAIANKYNAIIWTQDKDFIGIKRVKYIEKKK